MPCIKKLSEYWTSVIVLSIHSVTIQIKAIEQYFPVVLFFFAAQGGFNFGVCG